MQRCEVAVTASRAGRTWTSAALGFAASVQVFPAATWIPAVRRLFPGLSGVGRAGHVALTFDDGPYPGTTEPLLDLLSQRDVRATFFLIGQRAARAPHLVREVAARDHELAVHGWTHDYTLWRSPRSMTHSLRRTKELIEDLTGQSPTWYRPPYGVLSGSALWGCRRAGLRPILWSAWGRDWESQPAPRIAARVLHQLRPGGTILLHVSPIGGDRGVDPQIRQATDLLVEACRDSGSMVGPLKDHR